MELPLFPLHTVVFPGETLSLQVFEQRYHELMRAVLSTDRRFGVVAIARGRESGGHAEIHPVGCVVEVEQVRRLGDGRMGLVARGRERFIVEQRLPDQPYPRALAEPLTEPAGDRAEIELAAARAAMHRYLSVVARTEQTEVAAPATADPVGASYAFAAALKVDLSEMQQLLEAPDAATRLRLVASLARREAMLLEAIGPSVGTPGEVVSSN